MSPLKFIKFFGFLAFEPRVEHKGNQPLALIIYFELLQVFTVHHRDLCIHTHVSFLTL